jgi:hypothetical protein
MARTRIDARTLILMLVATCIGAGWAIYNRGLTKPPYDEAMLRPLVWVIFATPFALFIGWLIVRWSEAWWAAFVCFCLYFFSPFVAQRYESCTVVSGNFHLANCFTATAEAQQLATSTGHRIYFEAVVVIQVVVALLITLHRAFNVGVPHAEVASPRMSASSANRPPAA